jgi:ATP-dependent Clp protease protease subunit
VSDIEIQVSEILRNREMLNRILATHTAQELTRIEKDTDRDFFLTAAEAKEYGLVDRILEKTAIEDEEDVR